MLKDPGSPAPRRRRAHINQVTFTRYRVSYRRTDGRNTPASTCRTGFDSAP